MQNHRHRTGHSPREDQPPAPSAGASDGELNGILAGCDVPSHAQEGHRVRAPLHGVARDPH